MVVFVYMDMNQPQVHASPTITNRPPTSLPIPSLWIVLVPCFMHQTWTSHLFHIRQYTCFNVILSKHATLTFFCRVQNSVLYICVSFAVLHLSKFHIYALIYCIGVFLTYFTLYNRLQFHPPH